jgi:exopolysaccharide production protein ExoZ
MKNRIQYLDYLRGLAAFGIMVYHFTTWSYGHHDADSFLGRIGIYAVSIFYALSGLTLFKVYQNQLDLKDFFVKRVFRIYPLLIVVTLIAAMLQMQFDLINIFLNVTGLFGVFAWDQNIAVGAWSIGNELIFYLFFPVFMIFAKKEKMMLYFISFILLAAYVYFAFYLINPIIPLGEQGFHYMNPMNQIFLFLAGALLGLITDKLSVKNSTSLIVLILSIIAFMFYPVSGYTSELVFGWTRISFTIICIAICFSFFKMDYVLPKWISLPLSKLGEATYSIYLLHPLVWTSVLLFSKYGVNLSTPVKICLAIPLTVIVSYVSYVTFERYFINKGKKYAIQ